MPDRTMMAQYSPATEDLWHAMMPNMVALDIEEAIVTKVIEELRSLGYEISIKVEVYGDMAAALKRLDDGTMVGVKKISKT